ncbi:LysR family transcriptional regulator [Arthrobacter ginkgonis]|uniref:LysR family transcriptional regulator n=1 Tax=Arthrobacter ginkgonis TaxID=1630594 RepID=UPI0031E916C2
MQYFLAVVEAGTITGAAESLHIAQPALSRQIKTLERELKLSLFETRGNRLVLTPSGRAFVPMAQRLMAQTRDTQEAVEALRTGSVRRLSCAATAASIRGFLAAFVASTTPEDPAILTRDVGHFELEDTLLHGTDFIVTPKPPGAGLVSVKLGEINLKAYVHAGHRWAHERRRSVGLSELVGEPLVLPSHHSVSRHLLDDALLAQGLALGEYNECDDGPTILALASAGHGVGVSTELASFDVWGLAIEPPPPAGGTTPPLALSLHMAWLPGHYAESTLRGLAGRIAADLALHRPPVTGERPSP